ncbi:hypothetical protein [Streptomyces sp. XH2]|uniref:hypothetical protein n=1 Tax=Streptomyces sp. XH2 TaxID=3412483 RepID=UPI003C7A52BB
MHRWRAVRTSVLTVAGFTSLTASAWVAFGLAAGLAVLGVCLLVIEFLTAGEGQ